MKGLCAGGVTLAWLRAWASMLAYRIAKFRYQMREARSRWAFDVRRGLPAQRWVKALCW